jgi:glycosyltransferase involved in cell wall biosynthesis
VPPPRPILALLRASARWTDVAQGVSRAVCDFAADELRIPASRVELLPNGFDAGRFTPPPPEAVERWRREHSIPPGARLIGVIGRLAPEKGHARLLRQMVRVLERVPESLLLVAGDGPLRDELRRLADRLGVAPSVRFLGQQDDVRTLMGALDVLAVPSDHEGFSFVTAEALSVGTPVVGTDRGGLPEVAGDGRYAALFSPAEEGSLGDALLRVLADPEAARRRARAAEGHLRRFHLDTHVQRQHEIYLRVAASVRERRAAGASGPSAAPGR